MADAPLAGRTPILLGLPVLILAGLFFYAGLSGPSSAANSGTGPPRDACEAELLRRTAWYAALDQVRSRMGSTHHLSFGGWTPEADTPASWVTVSGEIYRVEGWVSVKGDTDARREFTCDLERSPDGRWLCRSLELVQPY